jgi:serine/threonine protein phosphatase PrpC
MSNSPTVDFGEKTDVGKVRAGNEDSCKVYRPDECPDGIDGLLVVADGMGGHAAGEDASRITVETVVVFLTDAAREVGEMEEDILLGFMSDALEEANQKVLEEAAISPEKRGMGTTCTAALLKRNHSYIAHIGDSRAYLLRDSILTRLTKDHSFVEEEVERGALTPEEARVHPRRNVVTRAIGIGSDLNVDTYSEDLESGDRLMLCSDGLNSMIPDARIAEILGEGDAQASCDNLVNAANDAGGSDNITVVVYELREVAAEPDPILDLVPESRGWFKNIISWIRAILRRMVGQR